MLRGFDQPRQDRIGIDLEDPRRSSNSQPFGQTGKDMHDALRRCAFAMEAGTSRLIEIALARYTLQLPPGLAARMPIGADIPSAKPAVVGAIGFGTEGGMRVDGTLAALGEDDDWWW